MDDELVSVFVLEPRHAPRPVFIKGVKPALRQTPRKQSLSWPHMMVDKEPGSPVGTVDGIALVFVVVGEMFVAASVFVVEMADTVEESEFGVPATQTPKSVESAPSALTQTVPTTTLQSESEVHI